MGSITTVLTAVLLLLAALHGYWGFGGCWPGADERSLVDRVVGRTRNMRAPSPAACFAVSALLVAAAGLVVVHAGGNAPGRSVLVTAGFWAAALVFLLRGAAGYVPALFRYAEGTPFVRLNRTVYSPLCLAVAAGFAAVD